MKFCSTRGGAAPVAADAALLAGAAPDGGLYLPDRLPLFSPDEFDGDTQLSDVAQRLLAPFFADTSLAPSLPDICSEAFDFSCPAVRPFGAGRSILELFHGPTGAFKDFGARFLFRAFASIGQSGESPLTVLVATSGDTGGAVGCAAEGLEGVRAFILFPKGRISAFQERQLCCWRPPVAALRIDGDFDDCQRLVKSAFADRSLTRRYNLTSANSISVGRLLPQMSYWAYAALQHYRASGEKPGIVIPTGNLGNAFAAVMARACGLPIGPIVLATNANATLSDWFETGEYRPRPSLATLANAMDVGAPSNFERLAAFAGDGGQSAIEAAIRVEDDAIRVTIRSTFETTGYIACPHTATALAAWNRLPATAREERDWIVGATAHPAKFADSVEPLIGQAVPLPPALDAVRARPLRVTDLKADPAALASTLAQ